MAVESKVEAPRSAGIAQRARQAWARDGHLSLPRRLRKALQFAAQLLRARLELRHCNGVGRNARVAGRMFVENRGRIVIGDHLNINSSWVPTELLTGPQGQILIGDDVLINFGTVIAASRGVTIGTGSMIGPHCIISDLDVPEQASAAAAEDARPVHIGRDVWLAGRVTVRPGVRIGDGAVIVAGSIVESDVPAHVMASGIPARLLPKLGAAPRPVAAQRAALEADDAQAASSPDGSARRTLAGDLYADFPLDDLANELRQPAAYAPLEARLLRWPDAGRAAVAAPGSGDFAVIWTQPQAAAPGFALLLERVDPASPAEIAQILAEVDAHCRWVEEAAARYLQVFVPSWTLPARFRAGYADARPGGACAVLAEMNLRAIKRLGASANVHVLDAARWIAAVGPAASNPRAWYLGRMPLARAVMAEAALDLRAAMAALQGQSRRVVVLAIEDLSSGSAAAAVHPGTVVPTGERAACTDLQLGLRRLLRSGVTLAVLARDGQTAARQALLDAPGCVLRDADIAAWSFDSIDEAAAVAALAQRLSARPGSVVYLDTQPAGRARVRERLPAVYVPDWPADPLLQPAALQALRCFDRAGPAGVPQSRGIPESVA
jgi:acetyltransferase-like isoleucine patch superfamily enzyme